MSGWIPDGEGLTPEEADRAAAAEYVLGLLDPAEAQAFEARLTGDPALRAQVAAWAEDFAAMAEDVPPIAPPRALEAQLHRRLFPEARVQGGLLGRLVPWALGAAVAGAAAFAVVYSGVLSPGFEPELQARMASETQDLIVEARFDDDSDTLQIRRVKGEIPEGRDLELWLVRLEDGQPKSTVSLGVIPHDPEGVIRVSADLAAEFPQNALALSVEPPGGSPTGQATGPVVALGPLTGL